MLQHYKYIVIILVHLFCVRVNAGCDFFSNHSYYYINEENGLTDNCINDIFKDSAGYIWLATNNGISRFDGYEFMNFTTHSNPISLRSNYVNSISEDKFNRLWVATEEGLTVISSNRVEVLEMGLGKEKLAEQYLHQSAYWKNLWRADYEHDGARGFILPRDAEGRWLDDIPFGQSELRKPTYRYTPVTSEAPWHCPWWNTFFYEATSWEYSLSIPHDVPGLIEMCGGAEAFESRLDTFFGKEYYNVNNEPSFLSPCLYHWIGRPDKTSDCVRDIISRHYNDGPVGLPGNDDSGAMSSWLAFHMIGLYPNAGQDYYLIHSPFIRETIINVGDGKTFTIKAEGFSAKNKYIVSATLDGVDYPYSYIRHKDIVKGGRLVLKMGKRPAGWGTTVPDID